MPVPPDDTLGIVYGTNLQVTLDPYFFYHKSHIPHQAIHFVRTPPAPVIGIKKRNTWWWYCERITTCGIHRIKNDGDDHIILWNHNPIQETFPVTYRLTVNQLYWGYYDHPYHEESGPVPEFMTIHPPTQFGNYPWELQVQYGDVLTIRLSSETDCR